MITGYGVSDGKIRSLSDLLAQKEEAVWIDLLRPTNEEEKALEAALGIDIPTREEMEEIEVSSRLYTDGGVSYMTALIPSRTEADDPVVSPVTFALTGSRLLTIRYEDPRVFPGFAARAQKTSMGCVNADTVLIGLLEAIVDRLADVVERAANDADRISNEIFRQAGGNMSRARDFQRVLVELGRTGDLNSKIRDSLVTLERLFGFLILAADQRFENDKRAEKDLRARLKTLSRDAQSLTDHVSFVSQKITFLLDATLGMINIEQNQIIKIFSVVAVCFLPPTLIASIYGMNFHFMPELSSRLGYPTVIIVMTLSAILPLLYFKKRGWL
ncbi:MAG TPA: magnesium transporter CorA family protein [Amphiplicatus sp.]|nr:magnesium transporter CorA family protein [Amphiplicatus sp.]